MAKKKKLITEATASLEKDNKKDKPQPPIKFKAGKEPGELILPKDDEKIYRQFLTKAFGTSTPDSQDFILGEISGTFRGVMSSSGIRDSRLMVNACAQTAEIMCDIQPQNALERMLASQMVGVHQAVMHSLANSMLSDQTAQGIDMHTNRAVKLMRTFTSQVETLKRYRTGGQQKMVVEHVHVHSGGQAIVGEVHSKGGVNEK